MTVHGRKEAILKYVTEYYAENACGPSMYEIGNATNCVVSQAYIWADKLCEEGLLTRERPTGGRTDRALRPTGKADIVFNIRFNGVEADYIPVSKLREEAEIDRQLDILLAEKGIVVRDKVPADGL